MSEPFIGEIKIVGFNFAPRGWAMCDGQVLPINNNQSLYSLIGTRFGGDGRTSFALPDLRGRVPVHKSDDLLLGQRYGVEKVTLNKYELGAHSHTAMGTSEVADVPKGSNQAAFATSQDANDPVYGSPADLVSLNAGVIVQSPVGGSEPHNNIQPMLTLTFCIALLGLFPSRN